MKLPQSFLCLNLVAASVVFSWLPLDAQPVAPPSGVAQEKPRLLVLTDISNEPDDEESLVRLLVYSNEFDLEGLVATTSVWLRKSVRPELIKRSIEAYGKVRSNLLLHAPDYPTAEQLTSVVKAGLPLFGMAGVGDGKESEGSQWIIQAVDKSDERPIWISIWGGSNCLAQALWDLKRTRSPEQVDAFVAKLRVYTISDQDDAGYWIRQTFPKLFFIVSPSTVNGEEYYTATWTGISGDRHYKNAPYENFDLVDNPWLTEHVLANHGPLGQLYPKVAYIMEGDTPSFLNLIPNGLASDVSPDWGGWGGRYALRQPYGESRPIWTNSRDTVLGKNGQEYTSNQATIWRWREAYQDDFAARMDWCVKPREEANHNPIAVVNGIKGKQAITLTSHSGKIVSLNASGSEDPDQNTLTYRWFHYPEAGSPPSAREPLTIEGSDTPQAHFKVPNVKQPESLHIILELRDDGTPKLYSYRRVIVNVQP